MSITPSLHGDLATAARRRPDHPAVVDPAAGRTLSYRQLDVLSDRLRDRLRHLGVGPGDRVGLYLRKSTDAVAAIFGVLKSGAAYVPLDPGAPPGRNAYVLADCDVMVALVEDRFVAALEHELAERGARPRLLVVDDGQAQPLEACLARADADDPAPASATAEPVPDDVAYILYTSGSTGRPKGVVLSHGNATSFVDWCSETFRPEGEDRFSSHAPFHFDLSILDLYLPVKHGATLVLVGEGLAKNPAGMVELIDAERLTVWYSTPSVLTLLVEHGKLERHPELALRLVLFAGEVFPIKHLRRLRQLVPRARLWNLYGPTETNVCTAFEIPATIPPERARPYPIGEVCSHLEARVVDGELLIRGASVTRGYWNLPQRTAQAFLELDGERWYRTGDLVVEDAAGVFTFLGRRDRMVKRRGYRIELGEIEAALYRHPQVAEAAAVARSGDDGVAIGAFYTTRGGDGLSLIELKRFCAERLPLYMVPDRFVHRPSLPRTSTDKIDYQGLERAGEWTSP